MLIVAGMLLGLASSWIGAAYAQSQNRKTQTENYNRPKPREPIKPTIPDENRYQDDKVFLEYADSLFRPQNSFEEYQIVKGKVKFRQGNMYMFCDSAYYYPEKNSMNAFGHVQMQQGDTLFVYSDRLYYNGAEKHATLVRGPSRDKVELMNRTVSLRTDSLDYDVANELGWYTTGGVLEDDMNTLTSVYGEYSPQTRLAKFRDDVVLVNDKDGYRMKSSELDYNTQNHIASINTRTIIEGANDTIITTQGWYDTENDHAQLTQRSTILHSDSVRNVTTLEGDSIVYDKQTRLSRAFRFRDPAKISAAMVITDTARKVQLIGGYGEYNDSTREAFATEYPLLIEYSRPDSLFLRADTILSLMRTVMVWPDSLNNNYSKATRERLSKYGSLQELADSMPYHLRLLPLNFPVAGHGVRKAPTASHAAMADSVGGTGNLEVMDSISVLTTDSVVMDSVGSLKNDSVDKAKLLGPRFDKLGRDSNLMVPKDFHKAKAIGRARFFNKDVQGVADTLIYEQYDSMMYMLRKPVVWSGERQVLGNRIDIHLNDSTADWAYLPESGIVAEHVDEDFYNQVSGTTMKAFIENETVKRLEIDGNVQVIMMPQEKDSTVNKFVTAESSFLTADFGDGKIDHLKMWPDVSGSVTPIGQVKNSQKYLQGFRWLEVLRPVRQWYGDRVRWVDELGEVPEPLEKWFREAPLIKAPAPKPSDMKAKVRSVKANK